MQLAVRKRCFVAVVCLAVAGAAWAQDEDDPQGAQLQINTPGGSMNISVQGMGGMKSQSTSRSTSTQVIESAGPGFKVRYETSPQGETLIRVLEPQGYVADLWDEGTNLARSTVPMSARAPSGHFVRVIVSDPNSGATWEKKLEAKGGMVMSLWLAAPHAPAPAPAPVQAASACMPSGDFSSLKSAIEAEAFKDAKIAVLEQAAGSAWFCVDQVAQLVDLYTFKDDKVKVVELTRGHLLDKQNGYKLISHFDFQDDKARVKELLR